MKKIYEKPVLVRKGKLSTIVAGGPSTVINGGGPAS
ncbi:MAG: putative RiPP precursor [Mesorhizobium sp.]|nr:MULTISPECIES: hypothetical protein [unclassified Mesorhizobium]PBB32810.1 hypothetical protein CK214_11800 [Mesorhizobium sp. WSM3882]RUU95876.1 putative RiPP precursor [Mesorhizobium sp. M1A.F.Ca.IN.020.03.2.1]RUV43742.1 putative RiPP precursor [Mesorhizobium sp. M1A.T.Ca.IN.004.03.1.1]RUV88486.1 putative RiPP precursor [Mesorhizobium sp. M1A.F.Ca.IN.020.32.1.1]RUV92496.1 putative RiPP precursor [Mesorhizobium sp. M1A.F.Ca.IN.022.07.1.1]